MSPRNEIPLDEESGVEERPQNRREWSGPLRSIALPLLIVATIVGVLVYVERTRGGSVGSDDGYGTVELAPELNPTGATVGTEVGDAAPDFLLRLAGGGSLRLSDLRGTPLLVNFWATWCTPCREEMPRIVRAYNDGGFVVVAVNLQENEGIIRDFADDFGMVFPVPIDRTGEVGETWRIGGPIEGIPSSYFIDGAGIVRARVFGPMSDETLAENIDLIMP